MDRKVEKFEDDSMVKAWGENSREISKVERYKWKPLNSPGEFMWIPKDQLKIDLSYQRAMDSNKRVTDIARNFDWALFGTILVALDDDGYYILDGGHRTRAANRRDDVTKLPCLVFVITDLSEESRIFYQFNNCRKFVNTMDNHIAALKGNGKFKESITAIEAEKLIKKYGYKFARTAREGEYQISAIKAIYKTIEKNPVLADINFSLWSKVAQGRDIHSSEILGLYHLIQYNQQVDFFGFPFDNLMKEGFENIRMSIKKRSFIEGKGNYFVVAKALMEIINKGQVKNKIALP